VFMEWPIGRNLQEAEEIVSLARSLGLKTAVGLQGHFARVVQRIKHHLPNIGTRILSTTIVSHLQFGKTKGMGAGSKYALDAKNGATMVDIMVAHLLECVIHGLDVNVESVSALVSTMESTSNLINLATGEVIEKDVTSSSPDHMTMHGLFSPRASTTDATPAGFPYSITMRHGAAVGDGFTWQIEGDAGVMEITSAATTIPHINAPGVPWKIKVKADKLEDGIVEEHVLEDQPGQPAVGRLWDAFAIGKDGDWPDFEHGLKMHKITDAIWKSSREGRIVIL
jgi:predicted dehydrogenase